MRCYKEQRYDDTMTCCHEESCDGRDVYGDYHRAGWVATGGATGQTGPLGRARWGNVCRGGDHIFSASM